VNQSWTYINKNIESVYKKHVTKVTKGKQIQYASSPNPRKIAIIYHIRIPREASDNRIYVMGDNDIDSHIKTPPNRAEN
jgi:hypothetical protein